MTLAVFALVSIAISAALVYFAFGFLKKQAFSSADSERLAIVEGVNQASKELEDLLQYTDSYASKGQLDKLISMLDEVKVDLERERTALKEVESKLDVAQKTVEEKEGHQQEIKASREEDENKLGELLGKYQDFSSESVALEQKLAQSLKNLDSMMDELELTASQKSILQELSNSMANGGSRLRDLLTEYETLNERLNTLTTQHNDLEEEYTKLVEQQLGE